MEKNKKSFEHIMFPKLDASLVAMFVILMLILGSSNSNADNQNQQADVHNIFFPAVVSSDGKIYDKLPCLVPMDNLSSEQIKDIVESEMCAQASIMVNWGYKEGDYNEIIELFHHHPGFVPMIWGPSFLNGQEQDENEIVRLSNAHIADLVDYIQEHPELKNRLWLLFNEPDIEVQNDLDPLNSAIYTNLLITAFNAQGFNIEIAVGGTAPEIAEANKKSWSTVFYDKLFELNPNISVIDHFHPYPSDDIYNPYKVIEIIKERYAFLQGYGINNMIVSEFGPLTSVLSNPEQYCEAPYDIDEYLRIIYQWAEEHGEEYRLLFKPAFFSIMYTDYLAEIIRYRPES